MIIKTAQQLQHIIKAEQALHSLIFFFLLQDVTSFKVEKCGSSLKS